MSFTFTFSPAMDTPDQVAFDRTGNPPPPTPRAACFRAADLAHPRTPADDVAFDGNPPPPTPRAADLAFQCTPFLLAAPLSNAPDSPPFDLPSVSLVAQPVLHSLSYNKSKAVSSTTQVQQETVSVASAPSSRPHVGGSDIVLGPLSSEPSAPGSALHPSS